jgi:peroxiredoxin
MIDIAMKMRKVFKIFLLALLLQGGASLAQGKVSTVSITGKAADTGSGYVYLQRFDDKVFFTVDSARMENGRFQIDTKIELPELYGLTLDKNQNPLYVFIDSERISVDLKPDSYYGKSTVTGSKAQDLFNEYKKLDDESLKIDSFINTNPRSIVSAYVLYRHFSYRLSPDEIDRNLGLLDRSLQQTQYARELRKLSGVLRTVEPGKKAPDFTLNDQHGQPVKLSDHRGKYLLVDFWASWCGPCRRENPNLVKAWQKYKDQGFDVFGVSLDRKKENWLKAIKDDRLTWTQVSDLKFWNSEAAKLYGVRAIPSNLLLSPDGTILAKNLTGEALHSKLEELLGKQVSEKK